MQSLTVALIGANGQIGNFILHELLASREARFHVLAFIRPNSQLKYQGPQENVTVHDIDLSKVTADSLAPYFRASDVVVSAVGTELLSRQSVLQDAAAIAGVPRFYPSEFGMHSVLRMRTEEATLIHPVGRTFLVRAGESSRFVHLRLEPLSLILLGRLGLKK
jgi:aspartate-semialdehyde dehydrogenase